MRPKYFPQTETNDRKAEMDTTQSCAPTEAPSIIDCGHVSRITKGFVTGPFNEFAVPPYTQSWS